MLEKILNFLRGLVRPYLALLLGSTVTGLAVWLAVKFATPAMAEKVVTEFIIAAVAVFGVYIGARSAIKR